MYQTSEALSWNYKGATKSLKFLKNHRLEAVCGQFFRPYLHYNLITYVLFGWEMFLLY